MDSTTHQIPPYRGARRYDDIHAGNKTPDWAEKYMEFLHDAHYRHIFPWKLLPGEIRNIIYRFCLTCDTPIYIRQKRGLKASGPLFRNPWDTEYTYMSASYVQRARLVETEAAKLRFGPSRLCRIYGALVPEILYLDRRTFAEAKPILYSENVFNFQRKADVDAFLARLSVETKLWIRSVQIGSYDSETLCSEKCRMSAFRSLSPLTNLQRVELHSYKFRFWGGQFPLEELIRHVFDSNDCVEWLKAVGRAKGNPKAGADILRLSENLLQACCPNNTEGLTEDFKRTLGDLLVSSEASGFGREERR